MVEYKDHRNSLRMIISVHQKNNQCFLIAQVFDMSVTWAFFIGITNLKRNQKVRR